MKLLQRIILVVGLTVSFTSARSGHPGTDNVSHQRHHQQARSAAGKLVMNHISMMADKLKTNLEAINNYKGGIVATGPLGTSAYELWSAFRIGNRQLQTIDEIRSDDCEMVMDQIKAFSPVAAEVLEAYKVKQALLQSSRMGFIMPIFLDAIMRELTESEAYFRRLMGEKHERTISELSGDFRRIWNDVFTQYTSDLRSESGFAQNYKGFLTAVTPVLGLLL